MRADVVIGAMFGDEGKGNFTSYFAGGHTNPLVIRHSGGANAGHTVVEGEIRHIFSHFGSGTLVGAPTYLSEFFTVNPLIFGKEFAELSGKGVTPETHIDVMAPISTPYDMLINQFLEDSRGVTRHGSCGVGINETYLRGITEFATKVNDITRPDFIDMVAAVRDQYVPRRLADLGIELNKDQQKLLAAPEHIEQYKKAVEFMKFNSLASDLDFLIRHKTRDTKHFIFEGSQGLLLDAESHFFPHVTRARTGTTNVIDIVRHVSSHFAEIELDVTYLIRPYMTRHGAGPFPSENRKIRYDDTTNVAGPWQGHLRFGALDIPLIAGAIWKDSSAISDNGIKFEFSYGISCCDQITSDIPFVVEDGSIHVRPLADVLHFFLDACPDYEKVYRSLGPTRRDIGLDFF